MPKFLLTQAGNMKRDYDATDSRYREMGSKLEFGGDVTFMKDGKPVTVTIPKPPAGAPRPATWYEDAGKSQDPAVREVYEYTEQLRAHRSLLDGQNRMLHALTKSGMSKPMVPGSQEQVYDDLAKQAGDTAEEKAEGAAAGKEVGASRGTQKAVTLGYKLAPTTKTTR
jgi:hypothetical protein